jgi:hypothetical protein
VGPKGVRTLALPVPSIEPRNPVAAVQLLHGRLSRLRLVATGSLRQNLWRQIKTIPNFVICEFSLVLLVPGHYHCDAKKGSVDGNRLVHTPV